ncbi:MAG: helix-turn-helix transcriptional regulator [Nitrospiraceae bacterium]|nr:helix-turn-helix transcriptional regulator [Nitrospiraceae bacterium]
MALSGKDYRKLLGIIEVIYSVPDRAAMFRAVCGELQKLVAFPSAALFALDPGNGHFLLQDSFTYNVPASDLLPFCTYYAALQPLVLAGLPQRDDVCSARITDVISPSRHSKTEYCMDFLAPRNVFYELCVNLKTSGIGFHRARSDRDFTSRDKKVIDILAPHLAKALRNIDFIAKGFFAGSHMKSRLALLPLSARQREVAFLAAMGLSNREIARRLYISEQTAKDHLCDIFERLKVRRRSELTAKILGLAPA